MYKILIGLIVTIIILVVDQYWYVLPIHIGAFIISISLVILADIYSLAWVRGKISYLSKKKLEIVHNIISISLLTSIVTGLLMAWPVREYLFLVPTFWGKMFFVLVISINGYFIGRHLAIPATKTFAELTSSEKRPLFIGGAVSIVGWVSVFVLAQLTGL